jgi:8-oxo-dGTP pyrophosphatase MutT (NUDIX family)
MESPAVENYRDRARSMIAAHHPAALDLNGWMPAAVLILIYPKNGIDHVLLTVRTDTVEHHKGQISLPGGAVDKLDDDLEATALRETFEEVGILPDDIEVIGRLDDLITNSHFRVTPVVGVMRKSPRGFTPSPFEVAEVLEIPLAHLLDPDNVLEERRARDGRETVMPAYEYEGYRIWGATARMLAGFLELLQDLGPRSSKEG